MIVYRLTTSQYKNDLSGRGAEIAGGRWNNKGIPVLYTASSRALAAFEIAVHTLLNVVPAGYMMITIRVPDSIIPKSINEKDLPENWRAFPQMKQTKALGDQFFKEGRHLALRVPSAVVEGDYNILLNPLHKDFHKIKIIEAKPFEFDQRLFLRPIAEA